MFWGFFVGLVVVFLWTIWPELLKLKLKTKIKAIVNQGCISFIFFIFFFVKLVSFESLNLPAFNATFATT